MRRRPVAIAGGERNLSEVGSGLAPQKRSARAFSPGLAISVRLASPRQVPAHLQATKRAKIVSSEPG
jgi:hypothetical protein